MNDYRILLITVTHKRARSEIEGIIFKDRFCALQFSVWFLKSFCSFKQCLGRQRVAVFLFQDQVRFDLPTFRQREDRPDGRNT